MIYVILGCSVNKKTFQVVEGFILNKVQFILISENLQDSIRA